MPILIYLNGPPGLGKSTLARRYVEEHPGALNLQIATERAGAEYVEIALSVEPAEHVKRFAVKPRIPT